MLPLSANVAGTASPMTICLSSRRFQPHRNPGESVTLVSCETPLSLNVHHRFEQQVEERPGRPDHAAGEDRRGEAGVLAVVELRIVKPRESGVPVQVETAFPLAEGKIDLNSRVVGVVVLDPGRENQADARRKGGASGAFLRNLVAVVEKHAAEMKRRAGAAVEGNRVRQLMPQGRHRPLLGEVAGPVAALVAREHEDVLKDAPVLVERFFHQERVVEDAERRVLLRADWTACQHRCDRDQDADQPRVHHCLSTSTSSFEAARAPMVIGGRFLLRNRTASAAGSRVSTSIDSPGFS